MTNTNISILVTRPKAQAASWVEAFQAQGWQTQSFPTLDIQPLGLTPEAKSKVLELDLYRGIICISANAANIGLELLSDYWPQWPVEQTWYAVGPATAEAMAEWQIKPKMAGQHDSEGLLSLASLKDVGGERFLILKGEGGRETLRDTLIERGAAVDELPLYRRVAPINDLAPLTQWLNQPAQQYIAISSGDGLKNLMQMAPEHLTQLKEIPLVVVSERLARFAESKGFNTLLSHGTAADQMVKAITR